MKKFKRTNSANKNRVTLFLKKGQIYFMGMPFLHFYRFTIYVIKIETLESAFFKRSKVLTSPNFISYSWKIIADIRYEIRSRYHMIACPPELTNHNNFVCIKKDFMEGCHKNSMSIIFEIPQSLISISCECRSTLA